MEARIRRSSSTRSIRLGRSYSVPEQGNSSAAAAAGPRRAGWKWLWRKFLKEKRKIFGSSSVHAEQLRYDEFTYSQNFDQGSMLDEPDCLSRSFSVRFADPSRIFIRKLPCEDL
ncbi:uncharacterized protein LOC127806221 [Diospyros lotus]|uniref:uncharacterized protein LOC127806221 n=1 Tax=Diospyros lotus TaxID=55363 RepID=UPI00224DDAF7|nr:uncharacterized protein LOC127806221 [Diospyros lotus]